jgi:hypothetical protein
MNLKSRLARCFFAIALVPAFLGATEPIDPAESDTTISDLTTAVAEGKKTGKPIFIYVFDSV